MSLLGFVVGILGCLLTVYGVSALGIVSARHLLKDREDDTIVEAIIVCTSVILGGLLIFVGCGYSSVIGWEIMKLEDASQLSYAITTYLSVAILIGLCTLCYFLGRSANVDARELIFLPTKWRK